jgi:hypothetical protein
MFDRRCLIPRRRERRLRKAVKRLISLLARRRATVNPGLTALYVERGRFRGRRAAGSRDVSAAVAIDLGDHSARQRADRPTPSGLSACQFAATNDRRGKARVQKFSLSGRASRRFHAGSAAARVGRAGGFASSSISARQCPPSPRTSIGVEKTAAIRSCKLGSSVARQRDD